MTTLQCTIKQVQEKTSKKGNAFQRVLTVDATGNEEWFTSFATHHFAPGQTGTAAIKEGSFHEKYGQSYLIDDWIPGEGEQPAHKPPASPQSSPAQGTAEDPDVWRKKDLNICTQAFFKVMYGTSDFGGGGACLDASFKLACALEKKIEAYVSGWDVNGMKESLQDQVAREVAESDNLSNQGHEGSGDPGEPAHPAFDDDIPF